MNHQFPRLTRRIITTKLSTSIHDPRIRQSIYKLKPINLLNAISYPHFTPPTRSPNTNHQTTKPPNHHISAPSDTDLPAHSPNNIPTRHLNLIRRLPTRNNHHRPLQLTQLKRHIRPTHRTIPLRFEV
ncbi:hypothetical protein BT63DRAFT_420854 [Microthyrium microscopicum]|uniref:Uncharacterized protein n=1 Tax=Microthyrium microscopicum TaxID=703497 RepID=A0A6A6UK59_9PEZI|nr:hypothetical protein BT63DRAFT_420854 [Microthyrium microscopicum]